MNENLKAYLESVSIFSEAFGGNRTPEETLRMANIWHAATSDIHTLTPEMIRLAHQTLMRKAKFWPKPAEIRDEAVIAHKTLYRPAAALSAPSTVPISIEERDAIHAQMSEGGSRLLSAIFAERNENIEVKTEIQLGESCPQSK